VPRAAVRRRPGAGGAHLRAEVSLGGSSFEEMYRLHSVAVFNCAARLCGRTAAADITQDVFVAVWLGRVHADPTCGSLRALLMTSTHHRAVDIIRREAARTRREDVASAEDEHAPIDGVLLRTERNGRVDAALQQLKDEQRVPIVMAIYGQISYREVSEMLGLPEGTVKSRIRAGLRELHQVLSRSED
jgi:RNA polymerase sigma factor (sigma-70 family)